MTNDVNEAIDAGSAEQATNQLIDNASLAGSASAARPAAEPTDVATQSDVAHSTESEAEAATRAGVDVTDPGHGPKPTTAEPIAPSWMRDIEVEGLKCMQHIYDFGKGVGAEVVTFVTSGKRRVTPVAFKGVEINNFDYTGDSHMHANEESANVHLSSLKENA